MIKETRIFLPKTLTERKMLWAANETYEKRMKRMREVQTLLPPHEAINQEPAEFGEDRIEEAQKAAVDMPKEENEVNFSESFMIRRRERWRAARSEKEEKQEPPRKASEPKVNPATAAQEKPQKSPRKTSEPQVNPATAALRKQFAEIKQKISPANPAAPRIRWTPNLPIPPPDGPDYPYYTPPEVRSLEGFPKPPLISEETLRKRKREKEQLEREERQIDDALDTEVPQKPKRGKKRLNELEMAMIAAGMYPEDPDGKTGKETGNGKGRAKGGKRERPWEEKEKKGRGKGGGNGRAKKGGFVWD